MKFSHRINKLYIDPYQKARNDARLKFGDIIDLFPNSHDFNIRSYVDTSKIFDRTGYISSAGNKDLRIRIAELESERTGNSYTYENVIVVPGSIAGLYMLGQLLCNDGDEIYIPIPRWYNYKNVFGMAGHVAHTLSNKTSLIVVNSPSYCGTVLSTDIIDEIVTLSKTNNIPVIVDNIFSYYCYDERAKHNIERRLDVDNTIIVNSPSKMYNIGGWRVGYCVGPKELIDLLLVLQNTITYGASVLAQALYLSILTQNICPDLTKARQKRDLTVETFCKLGLDCKPPMGGNSMLIDMRPIYDGDINTFCMDLLQKYHVVIAPGDIFEAPGHIYLCYCVPLNRLTEGLNRLSKFCEDILCQN